MEDVLRDMHADKPRPSFEAACAEVRACTFTDETGEEFMLGIDDGESDDVIDEVMEVILADRDWDEDSAGPATRTVTRRTGATTRMRATTRTSRWRISISCSRWRP